MAIAMDKKGLKDYGSNAQCLYFRFVLHHQLQGCSLSAVFSSHKLLSPQEKLVARVPFPYLFFYLGKIACLCRLRVAQKLVLFAVFGIPLHFQIFLYPKRSTWEFCSLTVEYNVSSVAGSFRKVIAHFCYTISSIYVEWAV